MSIKLIVGLGNPGPTYNKTRHNAGAWFVEQFAHFHQSTFKSEKNFHGLLASIRVGQQTCHLLMPTTFMNHSGRSVQAVAHFYHYQPEEILIAHDELDLPVGTCRLKQGGGHGGHNGLRDIISCLGTSDFFRLRLGIGRPNHKGDVLNYVLNTPSCGDRGIIDDSIERSFMVMDDVFKGMFSRAMTRLHTAEL